MGLHDCSIRELSESLHSIPRFHGLNASEILKSLAFFTDVSAPVLEKISGDVVISEYPRNHIICRHGKFDERFHLILDGQVRAVIPTEDDPRFELFRLSTGDFFGEEIIFSSEPRENSIISVTAVLTLSMNSGVLKLLCADSEKINSIMDRRYIERSLRGDLRKVPLLTNLSEDLFNEVLDAVEMISLEKGNVVFREGDTGDAFYLIRDGKADVYRTVDGDRRLIAILADGQYFGEMSLLSDEARNATVETGTGLNMVRIAREVFVGIVQKDRNMIAELDRVFRERKKNREDILKDSVLAMASRKLLDLNMDINRHLDILSQCVIDTESGGALLATMPGSRYPYVYPRDSACASRFLYKIAVGRMKAGDTAYRLLGEIARFIVQCQRGDGYWGQRYGVQGEDKAIYRQEDNVAHGVSIICRYLLASVKRGLRSRSSTGSSMRLRAGSNTRRRTITETKSTCSIRPRRFTNRP